MIPVIGTQAKILYNFCENTLFTCNGDTSLMISSYPDGHCEKLAGSAKNVNKWILEKGNNKF